MLLYFPSLLGVCKFKNYMQTLLKVFNKRRSVNIEQRTQKSLHLQFKCLTEEQKWRKMCKLEMRVKYPSK